MTDEEQREPTDEEVAADLEARAKAEVERIQYLKARVTMIVDTLFQVLGQLEVTNSELLSGVFTLAQRVAIDTIKIDPSVVGTVQNLARSVLLNTANPIPADANIQLTGAIDGELVEAAAGDTTPTA